MNGQLHFNFENTPAHEKKEEKERLDFDAIHEGIVTRFKNDLLKTARENPAQLPSRHELLDPFTWATYCRATRKELLDQGVNHPTVNDLMTFASFMTAPSEREIDELLTEVHRIKKIIDPDAERIGYNFEQDLKKLGRDEL